MNGEVEEQTDRGESRTRVRVRRMPCPASLACLSLASSVENKRGQGCGGVVQDLGSSRLVPSTVNRQPIAVSRRVESREKRVKKRKS